MNVDSIKNPLNGQRRAKNVADKPAVIRPVCAEFKFENDAGCNTYGKINSEQQHPEFRGGKPSLTLCV